MVYARLQLIMCHTYMLLLFLDGVRADAGMRLADLSFNGELGGGDLAVAVRQRFPGCCPVCVVDGLEGVALVDAFCSTFFEHLSYLVKRCKYFK